jgi:hypothetical protein
MAINHPGKLQQPRNPSGDITAPHPNRWGAVIGKEVKSMVREGRAKLYKAVSKGLIEEL